MRSETLLGRVADDCADGMDALLWEVGRLHAVVDAFGDRPMQRGSNAHCASVNTNTEGEAGRAGVGLGTLESVPNPNPFTLLQSVFD